MSVLYDKEHKTYYCKYSFIDWTGKRRWTTKRGFARRKDAVAYEIDIKRQESAPEMTVAQLAHLWLDDCEKRGLSFNSMSQRRIMVKKNINPFLGDLNAASVDVNTVRKWYNNLDSKYSHATKLTIRTALTMIFGFGVRYYGLPQNPVSVAGGTEKRSQTLRAEAQQIWEPEEFNKFIAAIPQDRLAHRLVFMLLFYGGMRLGELTALGAADFDYEANTINIDKNYNPKNDQIGPPKTISSYRKITMPAQLMQAVKDFINSFPEPPKRVLGDVVHYKTIRRWLRVYAKAAGIKPIRVHDLRHSHASMLIHNQVPLTDISRRLGHKNGTVTLQVYSHFYKDGDKEIAEKLTNLGDFGSLLGQGI